MPKYCRGLQDPAGGEPRPCIFAQDGTGGRAQPGSSGKKHCTLCSLESLDQALSSVIGKGNLQRQLKRWRQAGSPTYEAAFAFGSLCVLSASEQQLLRAKAGEVPKFWRRSSWLHKRKPRLSHFLLGRPIPAASLDADSEYLSEVIAAREMSGDRSWRLHVDFDRYRKMEPFSNVKTKHKGRTWWRGKVAWMRRCRSAWWRAHRALKANYLAAVARGPPFNNKGMFWAMKERFLQAGSKIALSCSDPQECYPRWYFLTKAGDSLFFETLPEDMDFGTKQVQSATCSMHNALGQAPLLLDTSETINLLCDRGYGWYTHMLTHYHSILSPLVLGTCLERAGFKLEPWDKYAEWPAGATGLLQTRGNINKKYWAALKSCESRYADRTVYLLDCFQSMPVKIINWKHALQVNRTYAVFPVTA